MNSKVENKINKWSTFENLDKDLKTELSTLNEQELYDAFYKNIEFGTAGMRGILGVGTNRINLYTIRKATTGFGKYIISKGEEACKRGVAIAYDNRHMSYELAYDSAKTLASLGIKTYLFESLRPTPELSFAVRYLHCFGGIMITASHNPKEYNGYKLYDEKGCQLVPGLAQEVTDYVNEITDELALTNENYDPSLIQIIGEDIDSVYRESVHSISLNKNVVKDNVKIVFSPEHGTANVVLRKLFEEAGFDLIPVLEQCDPDPDFSNTKTPNPEDPRAYELALEYAKKYDADLILVCDPDADRMGVGVKHGDEYRLLTGNQSGAVLLNYVLSQMNLPENPVMFNTVVTSDLGEKVANSYGVDCEKTLTGFKFIGEKVAKYEQTHEKNYVFGYEESYGSLIAPFVRDKDAMQACLMLAEAACYYKMHNQTLVDVLNELYEKFGYHEETQVALTLKGSEGAIKIKQIMEYLRNNPLAEINGVEVVKIEDYQTQKIYFKDHEEELVGFYQSDVLKYYLADGSFIAIRPSGTEPKCKFYYCVVGDNMSDCQNKTKRYQEAMAKIYEQFI